MKTKTEILQVLVRECFFAQNGSRLAAMVGRRGRMLTARLLNGELGERAVNGLWDDVQRVFSVPEGIMDGLAEVWELSERMKGRSAGEDDRVPSNAFSVELSPMEQLRPEGMTDEVWEQSVELYKQDKLLYYILVAIVYAKRHDINPYRQHGMAASTQVVQEISERLHEVYPQQFNAHDAAEELVRTIRGVDCDSWWWIGYFGGVIMRLYHEPQYVEQLLHEVMHPMPFMDWQWWREDCSRDGGVKDGNLSLRRERLWYWQKNGANGGIYEVLMIEKGQAVSEAKRFQLVFVSENLLRVLRYDCKPTKGVPVYYELEQRKEDIYALHFDIPEDSEWAALLPNDWVMLDSRTDDKELVGWAVGMTKDMQQEAMLRVYQDMGLDRATEYELVDVECGRRAVRVMYRRVRTEKLDNLDELEILDNMVIQTAEFRLKDYPALRAVTVHSEVRFLRDRNDGQLYAMWNSLGVAIPIPS